MKNYFKILTATLAIVAVFLMPETGWGQTTVTQTSFSAISGNVNNDAKVTYSAYKGAGTSAPAVNSNAIRLYQNSASQTGGYVVIGVPSGYVITSATIQSTMATTTGYILTNTDPGSDTPAKSSFAVNNYSLSANTDYTVNSISTRYITFACFGTTSSARLYLSKISVTYQSSGSTPTTYTVTFDAGTGSFVGNTDFPGTSNNVATGTYTLPSATPSSVCASNGWIFAGWTTASVSDGTTTAPTLLTGSYSPTSDLTLYAVYSITEGDGGTTTFNFADIASANGWENGVAYTSVTIPPITITAAGGGNNGKWYTSGGGSWRMYSGGTVNISGSGIAVTAVTSSPSCSFAISSGSASFSPTARTDFTNITVTYGSSTTSYATSPSCTVLTATTVTIDASGITNTDVYTSTTAGSLSATVKENVNNTTISGATVTWSSSDESVATIASNGAVTLIAAGTTIITASYAGVANQYQASSATYTLNVTNSAPVVDYVILPYTWAGGTSSELMAVAGVSASGLGSDYAASNAPYRVKFDNDGDYILVKTDSQPGVVTIGVKMLGGNSSSSIIVQGSDDGTTFTNIETLTISGAQNSTHTLETNNDFASTNRYVRLLFNKGSGSNVGVGPFTIAKAANTVATTTTISVPSGFNTDIFSGTSAGTLSASVTETTSGNAVSGATVTWSSSDTDVATIDPTTGAVTLVGVGTTTITASYAGDADHGSSTGTYSLTVTNNAPVISASDVSIPYTATSGSITYTITNEPSPAGNLNASSNDWLTVGAFDAANNTIYFTCTANSTALIRTAIVTITYTYGGNVIATKEVTVTQAADPNAFHKISDITAAGTYKIKGTIVAKSTRGFVVGDGTGYIYYYKGSEPSNNIGDMVKLEGSVIEHGGVFEFNNQATITAATESNYHTDTPIALTGSVMDATLASTETHLSYYVQYQGKLVVDGTYYNITDIDGATTAIGSISYPIDTDFTSLDGKDVIVTGYYVGKSGTPYRYLNTMLGSIERNCDGTTVTITPSITNTDVYTSTAAGSLSATVTETESGDPVSGATVTWSSSNTSVATVDASGNVTLVAAGTTTITASYAGVAETYCESSATYELTVINTAPICNTEGAINFGNNGTKINSASVTGNDSEGNTWTITTVGTTSFTQSTNYSQVGSSDKPATSITFTTTLPSAVKISDFSAKFGGYGSTAGTVTLKVGETVVGTGSLNGTNDVTIENITEAEGNTLTVLVSDIVAGVKCYYISYGVTVVAAPTFSLASGGYVGEQYVSIACETSGATIHYTTDGSTPTESSSTYSSPITVGAGVTTLKAIAYYGDCESSITEATYTICTAAPNAPIINISGDECDNTRTVTITGEGNVTIYYTTDGTDPTTASTVYSSPFNLTSTTTVKAIAVDNDCPSGIAMEICNIMALSGDYEKVASSLVDWSGEYVIAHSGTGDTRVLSGCDDYGSSTSYGTYHSVSTTSNVLASAAVDTYKVIIEKVGETSTYTIKQGNYYISYTGSGNYLEFYTDTTTHTVGSARWTITWDGDNTVITNVRDSNRQIMYNSEQPRFACYTGTLKPIDLFKKVQGTATVSVVAGENIKGVWIEDDVEQTTLNTTVCNDVTFHATVAPNCTFLGWYNNVTNELVSTDIDYTHVVKGDITLRAEAGNTVALTAIAETPGISEVWINDGPHGTTATATVAAGSTVTFHALLSDPDNLALNGWFGEDEHRVSSNIDFQFIVPNNITSLTYTAVAQSIQLWTNVVNEEPDSWKGIVNNTLEITCEEDLAWLISYVNGFNGQAKHDMTGVTVLVTAPIINMFEHIWVPIGYDEVHPFKGTFDGGCNLLIGIHTDERSHELTYVENYIKDIYGAENRFMKYAGMFGYTEDATIKNTSLLFGGDDWEDCQRDWMTCLHTDGCLGALVGKGVNLDMERCYAVMGIGAYGSINSVGGLVGKAEQTSGNHAIKACIANGHFSVLESSYTVTNLGGIVGSSNYAVTDCFAIPVDLNAQYNETHPSYPAPDMNVTNKGAVVGSGTATSNVYAHPYATSGFTKIDGTGTANNWYALTGLGYSNVTPFSATLEREYGNYSINNTINGVPFADVLNQNVTDGYKWVTPTTKFVNGGYPLIVKENDSVNAVFCNQNKSRHMMLLFGHELNALANIAIIMLSDDDDDGDKTSVKADSDYDDNIAFYMYGNGPIKLSVPDELNFFIDENVAVKQSDDVTVNATVGVTLDNSAGAGNESRDWHMFSSTIAAGKIGIEYGSQPTGYPESDNDLDFGDGDDYWISPTPANDVYFPAGITAGSQFDVYSFFEPEYHWINLKRTTHWHQDNTNGITYNGSDNANGASFTPGKGYLVALGNNTTANNNFMQAKGNLNNGNVIVPITNTGAHLTGYNLLGNPYQSYLDFTKFVEENEDIWNSSSSIGNHAFLIYDADSARFVEFLVDANSQSFSQNAAQSKCPYINMHQAFFIVKDGSASSVKFTNEMCAIDTTGKGSVHFRSEEQPAYPLVNLFCTDSNGKKEVSVIEFDRPVMAGSLKMKGMLNAKGNMYIHWDDADYGNMFIDHMPDYVPVWFEAAEDGVFTMTWNTANANFGYMHLIDNMTGADIDCLANDSYTFEAHVNDMSARFRLVFSALGIEEETTEQAENFAFINGNELVVNGTGELSLIDLNGRVITTRYMAGEQNFMTLPAVAEGMYMLRLAKANDVKVQKIVIRK